MAGTLAIQRPSYLDTSKRQPPREKIKGNCCGSVSANIRGVHLAVKRVYCRLDRGWIR